MSFLGIDDRRLQFSSVSAAEGVKWAKLINGLVDEVRGIDPFKEYKRLTI
jgi:coenzyme F420-reducing hydrogenase delta subunit